jgi:predicted TIM-barrel fold metal-dependent hydrolase
MWMANGIYTSLTPDYFRALSDGTREVISPGDAAVYLEDLHRDNVWGAMMHGNVSLAIFDFDDPEFAIRCARIYNDYIAETYGHDPHLFPMPIIPIIDIDLALEEIDRVIAMGFRGLELPMTAPLGAPYFSSRYDPIWAVAESHGLPIVAHIGTGAKRGRHAVTLVQSTVSFTAPRDASEWEGHPDHHAALVTNKMSFGGFGGYTGGPAGETIPELIGGGVLERFPSLHFVMVEVGARWLQNLMDTMDDTWYKGPGVLEVNRTFFRADGSQFQQYSESAIDLDWPYPLTPSEYVKRQVHVTFMDDWRALRNRSVTGVEPLVWGNDYPHFEGSWPNSPTAIQIQSEQAGLSDAEHMAIFGGTLAGLLKLDEAAVS